jgi:DNA (cytosine-5)-methyltransferase 1
LTLELTHVSLFAGAGGIDLGLERAGWRTVAFAETDPYASALLAYRWPGVPNAGDVAALPALPPATLWTGGFPCQDLSTAGKRAGLAGERSGLALAFLDLLGRDRPPAVLIENVPGLLSSHAGRDLGTLLRRLVECGYGWAFRILDSQHFGVPQRRRRLFILAIRSDIDPSAVGPAEVLAIGATCGRDHGAEREAREDAPGGPGRSLVGTLPAGTHGFPDGVQEFVQGFYIAGSPPTDAYGGREASGLARRMDGGAGLAFVKSKRAQSPEDDETWEAGGVTPTLTEFDRSVARATALVAGLRVPAKPVDPAGIDSHRYRLAGNGVTAPVAEWIGRRLAAFLAP